MSETTLVPPPSVDVEAARQSFRDDLFEATTHGVRTWKLPDDLSRYRRVIDRSRPDVVVESGTAWGGSALWFADRGLEVVTIDLDRRQSRAARTVPGYGRITWLTGSSLSASILRQVGRLAAGKRTMVVLDSDHHAPHVQREIRAYGPLVSPGCYLVVEDGIFDLFEDPESAAIGGHGIPRQGGPLTAIQRTVAADPAWERDVEVEQLTPLTHDPAGWWRRRA